MIEITYQCGDEVRVTKVSHAEDIEFEEYAEQLEAQRFTTLIRENGNSVCINVDCIIKIEEI